MVNVSSSLIGLGLLTGNNLLAGLGGPAIESRAVRRARAQFTLAEVPPPWKNAAKPAPVSAQLSAIGRMKTIVDAPATGFNALPDDVQTAFTAYKALDRLRVLAEGAAARTASSSVRASLQGSFARGLDDLQSFLGTAPSDVLQLAFAQPARRAESLVVDAPAATTATKVAAVGVAASRSGALAGLTGDERFVVSLGKTGSSDSIAVDLAGTPRPPTLDSVSDAINAAIAAVPQRRADGSVVTDAAGLPVPKWGTRFVPEKVDGKWGLAVSRVATETVAIDQVGAGDALIVAAGAAATGAASTVKMLRFDAPGGAMERRTIGTIAGVDGDATERARLTDAKSPELFAATTAAAVATDAGGFSYVVGTTSGDLGANLSDGAADLFLTKMDSEGRVVWQRGLGSAGAASGAAVTVAANGDIVVAGTVTGGFDGATSDGDMLVARFDAGGNEEFATLVRAAGADSASAVAVAADGAIFVGGRSARGDAFVAKLGADGRVGERRTIDSGGSDGVTALAVDAGGDLLVLTKEGTQARLRRVDGAALSTDLRSIGLGAADARGLAGAADGSFAVVGATGSALPGAQVNGLAGGRDGFVARIDAGLTSVSTTYVGSAGDDQIDSVAFMGTALYVGGRTTGALDGARQGTVDGFVTRIDAATGAVGMQRQFGQAGGRSEPVRVAAATGGNTVLGALGLRRGTLTPETSAKLVEQTGLRAGDAFALRVDGGPVRKVVVTKDDTLTTLADRVRRVAGRQSTVTTPKSGAGNLLRIEARPGSSIEMIAGPDGRDALAKLGIPAARIAVPGEVAATAPKVRPGGSFGLDLSRGLGIGTAVDAGFALGRLKQAISVTQTGYRSLYWDEGKAALVDGSGARGGSTAREAAQMTQYQAALDRLSNTGGSGGFTGF